MLSPYAGRDLGFTGHEVYTILGLSLRKKKKKYNTTNTKLGTGPWKGSMQESALLASQ